MYKDCRCLFLQCAVDVIGQRSRTVPALWWLLDHCRHRKSATFPAYIRRPLPVGVALRRTSSEPRAVSAGTSVSSTSPPLTLRPLPRSPETETVMQRTAAADQRGSRPERCVGATLWSTKSWTRWRRRRVPDTGTRWQSAAEPATDKGPCSCRRQTLSVWRCRRIPTQMSTIKRTCFYCNLPVSRRLLRALVLCGTTPRR